MKTTAVALALLATACTSGGPGSSDALSPAAAPTLVAPSLPSADPPAPLPMPTAAATTTATVVPAAQPVIHRDAPAASGEVPVLGVPGRLIGTVRSSDGSPLVGAVVLSGDLVELLARTDDAGAYDVRCTDGLVFAAYAFGSWSGAAHQRSTEHSPGIGNHAFRTRVTTASCGLRVDVTMPPGGVVAGTADAEPGSGVVLSRVVGGSRNDSDGTQRYGAFTTTVAADRSYRIEGLATGRYSIETSYDGFPDQAAFLDVHEGTTTDGSYTYYMDTAICYEEPTYPGCGESPSPRPPSPVPSS